MSTPSVICIFTIHERIHTQINSVAHKSKVSFHSIISCRPYAAPRHRLKTMKMQNFLGENLLRTNIVPLSYEWYLPWRWFNWNNDVFLNEDFWVFNTKYFQCTRYWIPQILITLLSKIWKHKIFLSFTKRRRLTLGNSAHITQMTAYWAFYANSWKKWLYDWSRDNFCPRIDFDRLIALPELCGRKYVTNRKRVEGSEESCF